VQDLPVTAETGFLKTATALEKTFPVNQAGYIVDHNYKKWPVLRSLSGKEKQ
jgi:hypothetical protein